MENPDAVILKICQCGFPLDMSAICREFVIPRSRRCSYTMLRKENKMLLATVLKDEPGKAAAGARGMRA
jgi:hypothetical protein